MVLPSPLLSRIGNKLTFFNRLTSGIVSPSELPDSPTQTVPPSPKTRKATLEFPTRVRVEHLWIINLTLSLS
ncbi:hypothetical protein NQ317_011888 [Molorchus minor]|uniref:Uncharacterized protein n=1 Tax=Molorchus minor TaxID=1323400 RepID=A0ABQ9JW81_9CUCU|nr:hypothetical protein NQ317_011888 [Molorchus minor]